MEDSGNQNLEPQIQRMLREDIDRVLKIEQASFSQPYTRELFEEELHLDLAHPCVMRVGDAMVGFMDYWIIKDEMHLITIAVDPSYRRLGLATKFLNYLIEQAGKKQVKKIFLDVRKSNEAAIALYDKFEFSKIGIRKKYYSDNDEGAIVMEKKF